MSELLLDRAGRRRSPATLPGFHAGSAIGNVLWFVLAGWWLILLHLVTGALLCLTIIGIPLGLANLKLILVTFRPFGRDIVSIEEAERRGLHQESAVPR
jgi:uncharacterized membrane protein YccF (DUF307 family)